MDKEKLRGIAILEVGNKIKKVDLPTFTETFELLYEALTKQNPHKPVLAVRCNLSKDDEIALYEKFLDEFTDKDGLIKPCNPDAIFNWFGWQL